eukprot:TRINITY_DN360_c0_g2_i3.p3 TRINITY_DN360_c0_g2~~TRINITY_DN360_c0_g2_i3.p3  ORF type:complete len:225 (+),score=2.63 TRINITY_DN360_c0_g2_i3:679-1353(+)
MFQAKKNCWRKNKKLSLYQFFSTIIGLDYCIREKKSVIRIILHLQLEKINTVYNKNRVVLIINMQINNNQNLNLGEKFRCFTKFTHNQHINKQRLELSRKITFPRQNAGVTQFQITSQVNSTIIFFQCKIDCFISQCKNKQICLTDVKTQTKKVKNNQHILENKKKLITDIITPQFNTTYIPSEAFKLSHWKLRQLDNLINQTPPLNTQQNYGSTNGEMCDIFK